MKTIPNEKYDKRVRLIIIATPMICFIVFALPTLLGEYVKPIWHEKIFWEECVKQDEQIPPNTELLISACTNPEVRGVPEGDMLFVREKKTGEVYILDLRTGEKKQVPNDPVLLKRGIFLSSELVWLEGEGGEYNDYYPYYVLDITDGQKYKLVDLSSKFNSNAILENDKVNPDLLLYFTEAEQIFFIDQHNVIIALSPNFRQNLERNVHLGLDVLWQEDTLPDGDLLLEFLKNLQVDYKIIDFYNHIDYAEEIPEILSPTGKYVVRNDGIYDADTNMPIILDYTSGVDIDDFVSWYYHEHSIVIALRRYSYETFPWLFLLPRPVIKLNLPIP